jgi:copper resistance protein B
MTTPHTQIASMLFALAVITPLGLTRAQEHTEHAAHAEHAYPKGPQLPPITPADREAAFPDLGGHGVHDDATHTYFLFDQLEWQDAGRDSALSWDAKGWIGGDVQRLWLRTEGEREGSRTSAAELHALWGRKVTPWWDVVAGLRQDFEPGSQTFAALGIQGLAPYKLEIEATAYAGEGGQTAARLKAEYELLITNRWMLQPLIELNAYGKDDTARGIRAGLSSLESGLRLRYEIRRELAPYLGVTWNKKFGATADLTGDGDVRFIAGVRAWL